MTKSDLIEALAAKLKTPKKEATCVVEAIFGQNGGIIVSALRKGDPVAISGFGVFEVKKRAARKARNPKTGESVLVPSSVTACFKPGKTLKETLKR